MMNTQNVPGYNKMDAKQQEEKQLLSEFIEDFGKKMVYEITTKIVNYFDGRTVNKEEIDIFMKNELKVDDIKLSLGMNIRKKRETRQKVQKQCIGYLRNGQQCHNFNVTKASNYALCPNCQTKQKNKNKPKNNIICGNFVSNCPKIFDSKYILESSKKIHSEPLMFLNKFINTETLEQIDILMKSENDTGVAICEISGDKKMCIDEDLKKHLSLLGYEIYDGEISDSESSSSETSNEVEIENQNQKKEEVSKQEPFSTEIIESEEKRNVKRKLTEHLKDAPPKKKIKIGKKKIAILESSSEEEADVDDY